MAENKCISNPEHCNWLFGILFAIMVVFIVGAGWAVEAGYSASQAASNVETKLKTGDERDIYIIKSLDEIKAEQREQRKLLETNILPRIRR